MKLKMRCAGLGLSAVGIFVSAFILFSILNPNFNPIDDYVSKLGALGQPYALWWNLIGFGLVGLLLTAFGWCYGYLIQDRLVGILLASFGIGFAATGVPIDLANEVAPVSKAHIVAICLGLAGWMFGLARMGYSMSLERSVRRLANTAATLLFIPLLGQIAQLWSMPVTHRLVFVVVFGWVLITCIGLKRKSINDTYVDKNNV